ncbi:MAG: cell division protein FtsL [Deltaproteobacteria bacterium]|nr:cell division protein FtsL [Deltaproteobacteria bacterium]
MAATGLRKIRRIGLFGRGREKAVAAATTRGLLLPALVLGLCLVGLALLHVWLRLQVIHLGYVLSTTSKVQSQLEQENRELKLELATLTSADRLEEKARARLGLRQPENGQVVILP